MSNIDVLLGLNEDAAATLLWSAATYTPPAGVAVTIQVHPMRPDEIAEMGETRIWHESAFFQVRVSELASPVEGGVLVYGGTSYTVKAKPRRIGPRRRLWAIETRPT